MDSLSIGAVGAALIAAFISLLSLIISKESKTSEFRQAWIEALRNDIANAISLVALLAPMLDYDFSDVRATHFLETFSQTTAALARVELRLNSKEADHRRLIGLIRSVEIELKAAEEGRYDQHKLENLQDRVVSQAQEILKREWERVKAGEPTFRTMKWIALCLLVGLGLLTTYKLTI